MLAGVVPKSILLQRSECESKERARITRDLPRQKIAAIEQEYNTDIQKSFSDAKADAVTEKTKYEVWRLLFL